MNSLTWCCPRVPVSDLEIDLRLGNDLGGASDVEAPRCEKLLAGFRLRGMRPEASRDRRVLHLDLHVKGECPRSCGSIPHAALRAMPRKKPTRARSRFRIAYTVGASSLNNALLRAQHAAMGATRARSRQFAPCLPTLIRAGTSHSPHLGRARPRALVGDRRLMLRTSRLFQGRAS
jgi:hypothetical protein